MSICFGRWFFQWLIPMNEKKSNKIGNISIIEFEHLRVDRNQFQFCIRQTKIHHSISNSSQLKAKKKQRPSEELSNYLFLSLSICQDRDEPATVRHRRAETLEGRGTCRLANLSCACTLTHARTQKRKQMFIADFVFRFSFWRTNNEFEIDVSSKHVGRCEFVFGKIIFTEPKTP